MKTTDIGKYNNINANHNYFQLMISTINIGIDMN